MMRRSRHQYSASHPEKARSDWLKVAYGITRAEYDLIAERQGGLCAICRQPSNGGRRLAVDHDHRTGAVRGLLCMNCNRMLGQGGDDPERLRQAIAYLTKDL
jgi:hypothetical protein